MRHISFPVVDNDKNDDDVDDKVSSQIAPSLSEAHPSTARSSLSGVQVEIYFISLING